MITKITKTEVSLECQSCGSLYAAQMADLLAGTPGMQPGSAGDPNVVKMPPCPGCSTMMFYQRTFDNPSTFARTANTLHYELCKRGQIEPSCDPFEACALTCDPAAGVGCFCCRPVNMDSLDTLPNQEMADLGFESLLYTDMDDAIAEALAWIYREHKAKNLPLPDWFISAQHYPKLKELGLV